MEKKIYITPQSSVKNMLVEGYLLDYSIHEGDQGGTGGVGMGSISSKGTGWDDDSETGGGVSWDF